jgi:serine/threonine-protein kinase
VLGSNRSLVLARAYLATFAMGAALAIPTPANADATPSDKAAAEALFDDARRLMTAQQFSEACKKFEASQRLDAGIGTMLYLADCYEKSGRSASAWAMFREASSTAAAAGQTDRASVAAARAAALADRLSKLSIQVTADAPGLEIRRNGTPVAREAWAQPMPVDPGAQVIEATAPGKKPWSIRYDMPAQPGSFAVVVPALEDAASSAGGAGAGLGRIIPSAATAPSTTAPDAGTGNTQRAVGLVVAAAGVVGLAIGGVFVARAVSKDGEADVHCAATTCFDTDGPELADEARSAGNVATVALGIGAAALTGGAIVYFTAPRASTHVAAHAMGRDGAIVAWGGVF